MGWLKKESIFKRVAPHPERRGGRDMGSPGKEGPLGQEAPLVSARSPVV